MFQREFYFYNSVRKSFEEIVETETENIDEMLDFLSKSFTLPGPLTFDRGFEEPLVLEDLTQLGYTRGKDDIKGFDLNHTEVAMGAFGQLHALGMVLLEKKGLDEDNLVELLDLDMRMIFTAPFIELTEKGMISLKEWMLENNYSKEALENLDKKLDNKNWKKDFEQLYEEGKAHELQTIQHGDANCYNVLFKYDTETGRPTSSKLVDFQVCSCFPPFYDLTFFLGVWVQSDVLIPHYNTILER